jgi:hypothetical protein
VRPDFEIEASLRAKLLTVRAPPDGKTEPAGTGVTIARRERRSGLPPRTHPDESYAKLAVEKEVLGSLVEPPAPT